MSWLDLGLVNMLSITLLRLSQKAFVKRFRKINSFRLNWLAFILATPLYIAILTHNGHQVSHLSMAFWLTLIAVVAGFYPLATYLFFSAIRKKDLSEVLPLLGFVPIFTALFGWLILSQNVKLSALIGIMFICSSIYFLNANNKKSWYAPIALLVRSRAAQSMLVVSLLTSISALGDKYAIERSSASVYFAFNSIGAIIVLFLCDFALTSYHKKPLRKELRKIPSKEFIGLILLGTVFALNQIISFMALNRTANTSYIVAIRNTNIVFASLIALVLYRESVNRHKLICYGLSAIGVVMIAL